MSPGAGLSSVEVDSDGSGPRPPVTVLCGLRGGEAVTALTHDTEDKTKVDGFQSPGSFAQSIHYQVSSLALCNSALLSNLGILKDMTSIVFELQKWFLHQNGVEMQCQ